MTLTNGNAYAYQWDVGLSVATDDPVGTEVRFANKHGNKSIPVLATQDGDDVVYKIPNILLTTGRDIIMYSLDGEGETTEHIVAIDELPVYEAQKPDDYVWTDAELRIWDSKINEPYIDGADGDVLHTDGEGGRYWDKVDYSEIENRPSINGVEVDGNKTGADYGLAAASDITSLSSRLSAHDTAIWQNTSANASQAIDIANLQTGKVDSPASEGTEGQVLHTDGNGSRYWGDVGKEVLRVTFSQASSASAITSDKTWSDIRQAVLNNQIIVGIYLSTMYYYYGSDSLSWAFRAYDAEDGTVTIKELLISTSNAVTYSEVTVSGGGGGGTDDYTDLTNKPQINGVTLNANKTSSDLGLMPVPLSDYSPDEGDIIRWDVTQQAWVVDAPPEELYIIETHSENGQTVPVDDADTLRAVVASGKKLVVRYVGSVRFVDEFNSVQGDFLEITIHNYRNMSVTPPAMDIGNFGWYWDETQASPAWERFENHEYVASYRAHTHTKADITDLGDGLTDDIKQALLQIARKAAYVDAGGQTYYNNLLDALYPLQSISAVFSQGQAVIYTTDSLDTLKQYLVVTATYSDGTTATVPSTDYTLSGTLATGTSTVTVMYRGKTDTFTVAVSSDSSVPAGYTVYDYINCNQMKNSLSADKFIMLNEYANLNDYSFEVEFGAKSNVSASGTAVFGGRVGSGSQQSLAMYVNGNGKVAIHCHGTDSSWVQNFNIGQKNVAVFTNTATSPSSFSVNGATPASVAWGTNGAINAAIGICVNKVAGTNVNSNVNTECGRLKLYDLSGNLVADYVPCVRDADNQIGMYDVVGRSFYTGTYAKIGGENCMYTVGNWSS